MRFVIGHCEGKILELIVQRKRARRRDYRRAQVLKRHAIALVELHCDPRIMMFVWMLTKRWTIGWLGSHVGAAGDRCHWPCE